jgi:hypothetical protein
MPPYFLHVAIVVVVLGAGYAANAYRRYHYAATVRPFLLKSAAQALDVRVVRGNPDQPLWAPEQAHSLLRLLGVTYASVDHLLEGSAGTRHLSLSVRSQDLRIRLTHGLRFELSRWFEAHLSLGQVRSPLTLEAWVECDAVPGQAGLDDLVERHLDLPERARESIGRGRLVVTASGADVAHLLPALRTLSVAGHQHVVASGTEIRLAMTRMGLVAAAPHLSELRTGLQELADALESRA